MNVWKAQVGAEDSAVQLNADINEIERKISQIGSDFESDGDKIAQAILGIAFNQPVFPIDANIERIIARLYGFNQNLNLIKKKIRKKSELFEHKFHSGNLIQSFMDYGSIICLPRNPKCDICVLKNQCIASKKRISHLIPIKRKLLSQKNIKYSRG